MGRAGNSWDVIRNRYKRKQDSTNWGGIFLNELLYYPGFEINDERWLKFALLYLEDINTIIPSEADEYISGQYQLIERETNLLKRYRPTFDEAEKSSNDVIRLLQKYLNNPNRYFGILGKINVVDFWRERNNQDFELFASKFSYYLDEYCMDNGFGHRTNNGIMIPNQLGLIYMSILAHNIGTQKNISVITDIEEERTLSALNQDTWSYNRKFNEIKSVMKLIELNLPVNIDIISIEEIINFRNEDKYQKRLKAFRLAVTDLNNLKNGGLNESNYCEIIKHIEETKSGLFNDLLELSTTLTQVGLGVFLAINNDSSSLEVIKEIAGASLIFSGAYNLGKNMRTPYRQADKYITDIRNFRARNFRTVRHGFNG